MSKTWDTIVEDVQGYLARDIALLPNVNRQFLEALSQRERAKQLCLIPSCRFELYHVRLYDKLTARLHERKQRTA